MKRNLSNMIIFFTLSLFLSGCNINNHVISSVSTTKIQKQLTKKEKLDDFDYMFKILKDNYPFFEVNKRVYGVDWLGKKDEYINKIKSTKNDEEFYKTIGFILKELHNGDHTSILSNQDYFYYKNLYQKDEPWAIQLNNDKAVKRYTQESNYEENSSLTLLSINNIRNKVDKLNLSNDDNTNVNNIQSNNIKTKIISNENQIAYLKINSFNYFNFEGDMKKIKPFLYSIKSFRKLIIDIRGNGGGSDYYWENNIVPMLINKPLKIKYYFIFRGGNFAEDFIKYKLGVGYNGLEQIKSIANENLKNSPPELNKDFKYYYKYENTINPNNSISFKGKIYLLIDNGVGSSADGFASFAKNTGFATLIGDTTFGGGIGLDPLVCVLPNSGYVIRSSMVMGLASDGTCNEEFKTKPDIEVSQKWYLNIFKDKAIQYIIDDNKK